MPSFAFRVSSVFLLLVVLFNVAQAPDPPTFTPGLTSTTGTGGGPASATSNAIPSSAPAGGVTVTQPVQTADPSYYKIAAGVDVTFAWNFTYVLQYPKTINVQAYCSDNGNTYTLAPTGLPGTATSIVWNPYSYSSMVQNQSPNLPQLIEASYRLWIFDERGMGVGASPGLMSPNTRVQFALYHPQAYTPLSSGWFCASCSSAGTLRALHPAIVGLVASAVVMAVSGWSLLFRGINEEVES